MKLKNILASASVLAILAATGCSSNAPLRNRATTNPIAPRNVVNTTHRTTRNLRNATRNTINEIDGNHMLNQRQLNTARHYNNHTPYNARVYNDNISAIPNMNSSRMMEYNGVTRNNPAVAPNSSVTRSTNHAVAPRTPSNTNSTVEQTEQKRESKPATKSVKTEKTNTIGTKTRHAKPSTETTTKTRQAKPVERKTNHVNTAKPKAAAPKTTRTQVVNHNTVAPRATAATHTQTATHRNIPSITDRAAVLRASNNNYPRHSSTTSRTRQSIGRVVGANHLERTHNNQSNSLRRVNTGRTLTGHNSLYHRFERTNRAENARVLAFARSLEAQDRINQLQNVNDYYNQYDSTNNNDYDYNNTNDYASNINNFDTNVNATENFQVFNADGTVMNDINTNNDLNVNNNINVNNENTENVNPLNTDINTTTNNINPETNNNVNTVNPITHRSNVTTMDKNSL